jgi:peptidoglycan hydrolase-like protein with peptidoglycan-binding domain
MAAAVALVLIACGVAVALHGSRTASAANRPRPAPPTTLAPAPMTVALTTPAPGASGVDGAQAIVLTATAPLPTATSDPTIAPAVPGSWSVAGPALTFTPTTALPPSTTYRITVPAGTRSVGGTAATTRATTVDFTTGPASTMRLQELLAELGYLPFTWTPAPGTAPVPPGQAMYQAPAGTFTWTWSGAPTTLTSQWVAGEPNVLTQGAVMAFESDHGLTTDGLAGPEVWSDLLAAAADPAAGANKHGYTYALADQSTSPQTLRVWHDGALVDSAPANTGIKQAPTTAGTFPVFERLATQIMKGTNPDGSKYADPVAWVAYFDAGQAIHYIPRGSYGSYQSLGCVEVSYATGQKDWPYLSIGSLVTVKP